MLRFGKTKVAREESYDRQIKTIKIWGTDAGYIVIAKLIKRKNNSNCIFRRCYKTISFDVTYNKWIFSNF